jgi:threonine dehydrogenase-like Zn-dependent dehydrogenase
MTPAQGGRTMRAAIFGGPGAITVGERPYPDVVEPTDAVVRVALSSVCGTDLSPYRGESSFEPGPIGHEFVGVVEDVGRDVRAIIKGDLVIAPTADSDGTCTQCRAGVTTACVAGGFWTVGGIDAGQGEAVRVPFADATLVRVPGSDHSDETMRSLLTLSDVMGTGHYSNPGHEDQESGCSASMASSGGVPRPPGWRVASIRSTGCYRVVRPWLST